MVPAGIVLLTLTRLLQMEMRGSRGSAACMWLGTIAATINAVLLLAAGMLPLDERIAYLAERTAECIWPLAVLMAMVFYARHVIYVTNEPAPPPQGDTAARNVDMEPNWFERWRERRRKAAEVRRAEAEKRKAERVEAARRAKAEADAQRAEKAAKKPVARTETARPSHSGDEQEDDVETPQRKVPPVHVQAVKPQRQESKPLTEIPKAPATAKPAPAAAMEPDDDEAEDDDDSSSTQGLSRKERRRLRKLQRQNAGRF
jgi:hypothetical protein